MKTSARLGSRLVSSRAPRLATRAIASRMSPCTKKRTREPSTVTPLTPGSASSSAGLRGWSQTASIAWPLAEGRVQVQVQPLGDAARVRPIDPAAEVGEVGEQLPAAELRVQGELAGQVAREGVDGARLAAAVVAEHGSRAAVSADEVEED